MTMAGTNPRGPKWPQEKTKICYVTRYHVITSILTYWFILRYAVSVTSQKYKAAFYRAFQFGVNSSAIFIVCKPNQSIILLVFFMLRVIKSKYKNDVHENSWFKSNSGHKGTIRENNRPTLNFSTDMTIETIWSLPFLLILSMCCICDTTNI